jgi:hypothetical protein
MKYIKYINFILSFYFDLTLISFIQNDILLYYYFICFYVFPFVSITNFAFKKNDIPHHPAKNTNNKAGFFSGKAYFIIGNNNITKDAPPQFTKVEYGTIDG